MFLQPAQWRKRINELSGVPLSTIANMSYRWTSIQRSAILILVEHAYKNNPAALKLNSVMEALAPHRESGSPSVKKLLADVDEALL